MPSAALCEPSKCFVVAAPLYELLSAAVEKQVTGRVQEEPFSVGAVLLDVWHAVVDTIKILLLEVVVLIFGLLLVPVTTVVALALSAVLLGLEFLDYPMGRRRMRFRVRLRFARTHCWELLGLGMPLLIGLAVPFAGVLCLPLGVIGGTMLFLDLSQGER